MWDPSNIDQKNWSRGSLSLGIFSSFIHYIKRVNQSKPDSQFHPSAQGCSIAQLQEALPIWWSRCVTLPGAGQSTTCLSLWRHPWDAKRERRDPNPPLAENGTHPKKVFLAGAQWAGGRMPSKGIPLAGASGAKAKTDREAQGCIHLFLAQTSLPL